MQNDCKKLKKTYKCQDCDTFFETKRYLKRHVSKVHLKMKPLKKFICYECQAPFEQKQRLEYHMNKDHLNFKPNECDMCKKSFYVKANLKRHLKTIHMEEAK